MFNIFRLIDILENKLSHKAAKRKARALAKQWVDLDGENLYLDTETTGLGEDAEIVEISIIDASGKALMDTLIKPTNPIPAEATNVHGITNEMVSTAPTWAEVFDQFKEVIEGRTVVIFNADYDVRLIKQTCANHGLLAPDISAVCAMKNYANFWGEPNKKYGGYKWQNLTKAANQQGVTIKGTAHRALADCHTTLGVMQAIAK